MWALRLRRNYTFFLFCFVSLLSGVSHEVDVMHIFSLVCVLGWRNQDPHHHCRLLHLPAVDLYRWWMSNLRHVAGYRGVSYPAGSAVCVYVCLRARVRAFIRRCFGICFKIFNIFFFFFFFSICAFEKIYFVLNRHKSRGEKVVINSKDETIFVFVSDRPSNPPQVCRVQRFPMGRAIHLHHLVWFFFPFFFSVLLLLERYTRRQVEPYKTIMLRRKKKCCEKIFENFKISNVLIFRSTN